jgi:hypothetical protein
VAHPFLQSVQGFAAACALIEHGRVNEAVPLFDGVVQRPDLASVFGFGEEAAMTAIDRACQLREHVATTIGLVARRAVRRAHRQLLPCGHAVTIGVLEQLAADSVLDERRNDVDADAAVLGNISERRPRWPWQRDRSSLRDASGFGGNRGRDDHAGQASETRWSDALVGW